MAPEKMREIQHTMDSNRAEKNPHDEKDKPDEPREQNGHQPEHNTTTEASIQRCGNQADNGEQPTLEQNQ
eukprot:12303134-Prorocentrum_lima.AAC.1